MNRQVGTDPVQLTHTKQNHMKSIRMNPYIGYVYAKGRDYVPVPADLGEFPKTVQGVRFETEEEYRAAIHEMLNGM